MKMISREESSHMKSYRWRFSTSFLHKWLYPGGVNHHSWLTLPNPAFFLHSPFPLPLLSHHTYSTVCFKRACDLVSGGRLASRSTSPVSHPRPDKQPHSPTYYFSVAIGTLQVCSGMFCLQSFTLDLSNLSSIGMFEGSTITQHMKHLLKSRS